jgi:hypothetical protein
MPSKSPRKSRSKFLGSAAALRLEMKPVITVPEAAVGDAAHSLVGSYAIAQAHPSWATALP